ncbi:transcriptional regulator NrdR [Chlamydiota bacterium]
MKCPYCLYMEDKVVDSRVSQDGYVIRRRRECVKCNKRFTTYEKVEEIPLKVVKKDDSRQDYDRKKLLNGILKACEKRPVSIEQIEKIVDSIEREIDQNYENEVLTKFIGELVMRQLHILDEVAYVRFASVYRQFKDINEFVDEIKHLLKHE